ncbi:MAG: oligosaccharide flippase family protein [Rhodospirillales bacterium]|nr:oligosaccharide flippase family protein [Rhodospirillales bacterium]
MSLARGAAHGAAWSFATVVAERGAGFFVLALLMRVIPLRDVGLIAIASAISDLARVVANSGAGEQVQANPGNLEIEAGAFWSQLIASFAFMTVLWLVAPWVASAYQLPLLPVLRVMAVNVVITAFLIVPSARLASQFRFRTIGFISFGSTALGGACALLLAYKGHGLMALIIQRLVGIIFYAVAACVCARWTPPPPPALTVMGAGFRFSLPLMEAAFVDFIAVTGYIMLVGLRMPVNALAQFRIAQRLVEVLQEIAFLPARKVFMPVLVAIQANTPRRAEIFRQMLDPLSILIFFVCAVSGATAKPIVLIMFGEKWSQAVPVFSILTLVTPALAFYGMINPVLTVAGRTRLVSWYAWVNALTIVACCWLVAPYGLVPLAWALAVRGCAGLLLFFMALKQGALGSVWAIARLLGLPVAGLIAARLSAYVVIECLPPLSRVNELAASVFTAALVFLSVVLVLAPLRIKNMWLRLSRALLSRQVVP